MGHPAETQVSDEEVLKPVQLLKNKAHENPQRVSNFYVLCGSLVERYKRNQIQWHVHFRAASVGTVNHREGADFCALLEDRLETSVPVSLPIDLLGDEVAGSLRPVKTRSQDTAMLVDVAEIINYEQYVPFSVGTVMVGLQSINTLQPRLGKPRQGDAWRPAP